MPLMSSEVVLLPDAVFEDDASSCPLGGEVSSGALEDDVASSCAFGGDVSS